MSERARIQFDIDGVISDAGKPMMELVNAEAKRWRVDKVYTPRDLTSFDGVYDICRQDFRMSHVDAFEFQLQWGEAKVLSKAVPYKGAVCALRVLNFLYKGEIDFVTSRRAETRDTTFAWFAKHLPFIHPSRIHQRHVGDRRPGHEIKFDRARRTGARRVYEDEPKTIRRFGAELMRIMDQPYNRQDLPGYRRMTNWGHLLVHELSSK